MTLKKVAYTNQLMSDEKQEESIQIQSIKNQSQIELLEVFVERSDSMNVGQRLQWHLKQQGKILTLPNLPEVMFRDSYKQEREYYMKAMNARFKETTGRAHQYDVNDTEYFGKIERLSGQYQKESNTVFYYQENKVLILIDFSKSSSSIHPFQTKTFIERVKDGMEIFISNLLFRLENKYCKKQGLEKLDKKRKQSFQEEKLEEIFDLKLDESQQIKEVNEENSDSQPTSPTKHDQNKTLKGQAWVDSSKISSFKAQNEKQNPFYEPKVFLSIVASGLPPNNQMRLLIFNQRIDEVNNSEILKALEQRLTMIEDQLADNYQLNSEQQEQYLQKHLFNANYILNLMNQNAKPLLLMFTDATSSLLGRPLSGRLDPLLHKLHLTDLKIITVNLANENSLSQQLGIIPHQEHLKYLAYITRGAHFTYDQLIKLAGQFTSNYLESLRPRLMSSSFHQKGIKRNEYKMSKSSIKKSKFSQELNLLLGSNRSSPNYNMSLSSFNRQMGLQPDLSEQDRDHPFLNSLQKLMFARPCNYSAFLSTSDIQELVDYQERLIFEN